MVCMRFASLGAVACCLALFSACTAGGASKDGGSSAESPAAGDEADMADPQVLQDVVEAVFMAPGVGQRRAMRVLMFIRARKIELCGGKGLPLDSTANRFEQHVFPDLQLIRERGFSEPSQESDEDIPESCDDAPDAPSFNEWINLTSPWRDIVDAVVLDKGLEELREPFWSCLSRRSGLEVEKDVPAAFLRAVNLAGSDWATDEDQKRFAVAYADCGGEYFGKLRELLLAKRPAMVERHRELLERFAAEIVARGYVP